MGNFLPPILPARGRAIKPSSQEIKVIFTMPQYNNMTDLIQNGHCQLAVKTKHNNLSAFKSKYSPDNAVIYFNVKENYREIDGLSLADRLLVLSHIEGDLYAITFKQELLAKAPQKNTEYTVQVRFGDSRLQGGNVPWNPYPAEQQGLQLNFTGFARWFAGSAKGAFGEWSNIQTITCAEWELGVSPLRPYHGPVRITPYFDTSDKTDRVVRLEVDLKYVDYREITKKVTNVFLSTEGVVPGKLFSAACIFWIWPSLNYRINKDIDPYDHKSQIEITLRVITANGVFEEKRVDNPDSYTCYPALNRRFEPKYFIEDLGIETEERFDGVIAKRLRLIDDESSLPPSDRPNMDINFYRVDFLTAEVVPVKFEKRFNYYDGYIDFKDYTAVMGEKYFYVATQVKPQGEEVCLTYFDPIERS